MQPWLITACVFYPDMACVYEGMTDVLFTYKAIGELLNRFACDILIVPHTSCVCVCFNGVVSLSVHIFVL